MFIWKLVLHMLSTSLQGYKGIPVLGNELFQREVALALLNS
jgi:hypothetical protein